MGALGRTARHLKAGLAALFLITLAAALAPQGAQAQSTSVPAMPTGLLTTPGHGQVELIWSWVLDVDITYELRYGKTDERDSATWTAIPGSSGSTTNYAVKGLENGSEYSFQLRAVNNAGAGAATGWVTATPVATLSSSLRADRTVGDGG